MKKRILLIFMLAVALAFPQAIGIVRFTSDGTTIINAGDSVNNALRVNVVTGAAGVSHVDDAAFTPATDDGVPIFAAFDDTTPDSVNEGDAGILRMSANRNLYGTIRDAAGNELGANVSAGNALLVDASATTQPVSGTVTANQGGTWTVQPGNTANTTAWLVTGTGGTFPATQSGTWTVQHGATGINHGLKTITAAGTDEALAGSTAAKYVDIVAQTDNTGWIAIGGTGVDATVATGNGILLAPGDHTGWMPIDNLADIFVDSTVSGDGVRFTYLN